LKDQNYADVFCWGRPDKYGFRFYDCAVRRRDLFVFLADTKDTAEMAKEEKRKRLSPGLRPKMIYTWSRPDDRWFWALAGDWQRMVIGAADKPVNTSVSAECYQMDLSPKKRRELGGLRCFVEGNPRYEDKPLRPYEDGGFVRGAVTRLKSIGGWLYACGRRRTFGKRLDAGRWQSFTGLFPVPEDFKGRVR